MGAHRVRQKQENAYRVVGELVAGRTGATGGAAARDGQRCSVRGDEDPHAQAPPGRAPEKL